MLFQCHDNTVTVLSWHWNNTWPDVFVTRVYTLFEQMMQIHHIYSSRKTQSNMIPHSMAQHAA